MQTQKFQPTKDITVDGQKYIVQFYSPTFGLTLQTKLLRLLGQPFIKIIKMFSSEFFKDKDPKKFSIGDIDMSKIDVDAIGEAMQSLFSGLKDDEVVPLVTEILSSTFMPITNQPVMDQFETLFLGRYLHLYKLVGKTIGVQYADFLPGLLKRANSGKIASVSSQTTTG